MDRTKCVNWALLLHVNAFGYFHPMAVKRSREIV
jgi:hypothetical protein